MAYKQTTCSVKVRLVMSHVISDNGHLTRLHLRHNLKAVCWINLLDSRRFDVSHCITPWHSNIFFGKMHVVSGKNVVLTKDETLHQTKSFQKTNTELLHERPRKHIWAYIDTRILFCCWICCDADPILVPINHQWKQHTHIVYVTTEETAMSNPRINNEATYTNITNTQRYFYYQWQHNTPL